MKYQSAPTTLSGPATYGRESFWRCRAADPTALRQPPSPYDQKLSLAAVAWLKELPSEVAPVVLAHQFPRIANRFARFWDSPQMIEEYFQDLLVDRRGGKRKGFPKLVRNELYALSEYHRALRKIEDSDIWESIPYRRAGIP